MTTSMPDIPDWIGEDLGPGLVCDKQFIENFRNNLVTISARTTPYAYFNFIDNTVILSNSSSGGERTPHGDRLMSYRVGELSFHFVKFKYQLALSDFKHFFKIPDYYYCVHVVNLFALLSNISYNRGEILEREGDIRIYRGKGSASYEKKNIYGCPINDFHIIRCLQDVTAKVKQILSHDYPKIQLPVDTDQEDIKKGLYFVKVPLDIFVKDGEPMFKDCVSEIYLPTVDGLSTVNIKSFVKKLTDEYSFNRYVWVDHNCIDSLTVFENKHIKVATYCPNFISFPISNKYNLSFKVKQ